jgi:hypothetical protein
MYRALGAPPPALQLVRASKVRPGPFEVRIGVRQRAHAHMLMITMDDGEYWLHRLSHPFVAGGPED